MKKILNNLKIRDPETGKFESVPGVIGEPAGINYSTEEVLTGDTWIDGKPIYKKVITGTLPSATTNTLLTTLEELESLVNISGYLIPSSNPNDFTPINCYYNANYYFAVWMANKKDIYSNASFAGNYTLIVEYTKID